MYTATIEKEALEPRSRSAYYTRQKLIFILVMVLVSVIPLIGISFFSFQYYKNSSIEKTSAELSSLADSRKEIIELFLADQNNYLGDLMNLYPPEYLSDQANLERLFNATNRSGVITDLGVIDQNGTHRAYVGPYRQQLSDKNYAQVDWFSGVMQNGNYTSDIFSGFRGVPHFVVAVANPEKTLILRATVDSDMFNSLLARAEVGQDGDAYILNKKGEAQTPSRLDDPQTPSALENISSGTSVYRTEDYIYTATSMNNGAWVLVMKENINNSLTEFYSARNKAVILILLAIVLITSVASVITSSIINRIKLADQQRTELTNRMRNVEKMALVGRLAAGVSHEINNPLQIIDNQAGWIDELLEDEKQGKQVDREEYAEAVKKIQAHVKRAKSITHGLLGFSRTNEATRVSTDINNLLNETVSFLEGEANNNRITIIRKFREDLPRITTDRSQLQQVFLNIINNAIDAIGHDGSITVTTGTTGEDGVVAEFSDTGPGMRDEDRRKIFEPFFSTKKGENTGLGLSISYNIIRRLGGDIEAKNREQGGSIFKVFLPVGNGGKET
ncbi:MAG: ATP-binding protein [Thermoleophilia bacterium]